MFGDSEPSVENQWAAAAADELAGTQDTPQTELTSAEIATDQYIPEDSPETALVAKVLEALRPELNQLKEDNRRTRQSARDSSQAAAKRAQEVYTQRVSGLELAAQKGLITPTMLRELKSELQEATQAQAQQAPSMQVSADTAALVQGIVDDIWESAGLTDDDPEYQLVRQDLSALRPQDAIEQYRRDVQKAIKLKQDRMKTTGKKPPAVLVDLGGGAGGQPRTRAAIEQQLLIELGKPNADDALVQKLSGLLDKMPLPRQ